MINSVRYLLVLVFEKEHIYDQNILMVSSYNKSCKIQF